MPHQLRWSDRECWHCMSCKCNSDAGLRSPQMLAVTGCTSLLHLRYQSGSLSEEWNLGEQRRDWCGSRDWQHMLASHPLGTAHCQLDIHTSTKGSHFEHLRCTQTQECDSGLSIAVALALALATSPQLRWLCWS